MRIRKSLTVAAVLAGLSVASNAELSILHYYSSEGTTITNDLVGTANGVLCGVSTNDLTAVVTDGSSGQWNSTEAPPLGMMLPTSIPEELGTNAFSIAYWTKINTQVDYSSELAISDGTTGNWILATPYAGNNDHGSYVRFCEAGTGANYVDVTGYPQATNEVYLKVFAYDGSKVTLYINGEQPGFSSTYPSQVSLSGLNVSNINHMAINAGSPWGDKSIDGTTYAFGIFDQALTLEDAKELYILGKDATLEKIQIIGDTPVKFRNATPTGTGIANDVTLSIDVLDHVSAFASAELYLDGLSEAEMLEMSAETLGTTTSISSASMTLGPLSEHSAYVLVTAEDSSVSTNSWTFTMGDMYAFAGTPSTYATDYGFQPEISVEVVEVAGLVDQVDLYTNGVLAGTEAGQGATTTLSVASSVLEPGQVISNMVIVTNPDFEETTNRWTFTMGGATGVTVWNSDAPILGAFDIAQTNGATSDTLNVSGLSDNTTGHEWTYISDNDRPAEGQTFTTPSDVAGYYLDSVWLRNVAYDDGAANINTSGNTYYVRITDPAQTNTANFVKAAETLTQLNAGSVNAGRWIQFKLAEPVVLGSGKVYGFDVGSTGGMYFNTDGQRDGTYEGGAAYRSGDNGDGTLEIELSPLGDRAFIVNLSEAGEAFSVDSVSPQGSGINNPLTLTAEVSPLAGTLNKSSSLMLLDGVEQDFSVEGSDPYVFSARIWDELVPLSTHTATVVAAATTLSPVSNSWTFTVSDSFVFAGQAPMGTVLTNATSISLSIIDAGDYFSGSAEVYLDGALIASEVDQLDSTGTVTSVTSDLSEGDHTVSVVAEGTLFGVVTNTWSFYVKIPTDDRVWNVNAAGSSSSYVDEGNGTVAVAPPSGQNLWNNLHGETPSGGSSWGGATVTTNNFVITDTNGENPLGFLTSGQYFMGSSGSVTMPQELFRGWWGANAYLNIDCSITGLTTAASYDIYLYSTWGWTENEVDYEITEGFLDGEKTAIASEVRGDLVSASADDFSACVEGANYVLFRGVTPNTNGVISFHAGDGSTDCAFSGMQLREHPGAGSLPSVEVISTAPKGDVTIGTPELEAVIVDLFTSVDTNNVVLLLDGEKVTADVSKDSITTTVSYVSSVLSAGTHTAAVIPLSGGNTNEWTFEVIPFISVSGSPVGVTAAEATLQAVVVEGAESVASAVMTLDEGAVVATLDNTDSPTSTVTYVATDLAFGEHNVQVVLTGSNGALETNAWTFLTVLGSLSIDNADFDQCTQDYYAGGFDVVATYDVPGWKDLHDSVSDCGVQHETTGWWKPYEEYSAFMAAGDGGFIMSDYTVVEGDEFVVGIFAKTWAAADATELTLNLFYDNPTNVIESYTFDVTVDSWLEFKTPVIAATTDSIGGVLGVSVDNTGGAFVNIDELTVGVNKVLASAPEIGPSVSVLSANGGLSISWTDDGHSYIVLTNGDLVNGSWGKVTVDPVLDGDIYTVDGLIGAEDSLFYKLQYSE